MLSVPYKCLDTLKYGRLFIVTIQYNFRIQFIETRFTEYRSESFFVRYLDKPPEITFPTFRVQQ